MTPVDHRGSHHGHIGSSLWRYFGAINTPQARAGDVRGHRFGCGRQPIGGARLGHHTRPGPNAVVAVGGYPMGGRQRDQSQRRRRGDRRDQQGRGRPDRQGRRHRPDRHRRGAVPGLPAAQIVNGPDLSFESQSADLRYLDTYGHGTHMAGIMVGNDTATGAKGIAPGAKLTSIKVGTSNGAVDVSQVIAAVDWVVAAPQRRPGEPDQGDQPGVRHGRQTPTRATTRSCFAVEKAWQGRHRGGRRRRQQRQRARAG